MPPKKRDKEMDLLKNTKIDHAAADHALFLQAYEKPTQIYRFLRTRNMLSPIFLNRTLSYMKKRMSRSNKGRVGFKVDNLLDKVTTKRNSELQPNNLCGYMTLTFLGFYDETLENSRDYQVKVETLLLKICHKKRKESTSAIIEVSVGSCSVPLNPSTLEPPAMASAVSISSDTFSPSQGPNVKSYMLMLRVTITRLNVTMNGISPDDIEPSTKRIKCETANQENELTAQNHQSTQQQIYDSELIVYDKHNRCLLTNGEYDLVMYSNDKTNSDVTKSPKKAALMSQWETMPDEAEIKGETNPFDVFNTRPTLKLKLSWSQKAKNGLVTRPNLYQNNCIGKRDVKPETNGVEKKDQPIKNGTMENGTKQNIIYYHFLYMNNTRQQSEACHDLHCPWCSLDCGTVYSLLKHLKLCHSRFNFVYYPVPGGAKVDVSINDSYDGSYVGSPHDLIANQGRSGMGPRAGPVRRTALTHVLVCRPKGRRNRQDKQSLAEFLELDEKDVMESQKPYITGHNRLYHHTITCLPVHPKELDIDSEGETDPLWLQQKTMMMIDEFTDVNEGEKELMKMWNLHVMKYNFVGDCQIPIACKMFLQARGKELLEKNLYRNFVLHMCSLHDFGLITPIVVYQILQKLNEMLVEHVEAKEKMRISLKHQKEHWNAIGKFQQPTIIEQKSQVNGKSNFNPDASPLRRKTLNLQNANRMGVMSPGSSNPPTETKRKMSTGSIQSRKRSSLSERKSSA